MSLSIEHDIDVRWGDLDAFNHVNNTVFLRYLEEARIILLQDIAPVADRSESGPVVVNINCNFRREIGYPASVRVHLTARVASARRMLLEHTICAVDDASVVYADAQITVVWVSTETGGAIALPDSVREAIGN